MADGSVSVTAKLLELVLDVVRRADELEDAVSEVIVREHDGYRAQARRLEDVDETLAEIECLVGPLREQIIQLRRRWNDPDA